MPVLIALLRGVNIGGHHKLPMAELRAMFEELGFTGARTYVQSGNVVFRSARRNVSAKVIEDAIEARFGFWAGVVLRTLEQMKRIVAQHPFPGMEPNKVVVSFLASDPGEEARARVMAIRTDPEVLRPEGSEIFAYFPLGIGQSKLSWPTVERAVKVLGTNRNWNTVVKLVEMGEGNN